MVPTVLSTGQLLPTMLIFRNLKHVPKCKFPSDLVVAASKTGVMTSNFMTNEYLPKVSKIILVDTVTCRQIVLNNLKILTIHRILKYSTSY